MNSEVPRDRVGAPDARPDFVLSAPPSIMVSTRAMAHMQKLADEALVPWRTNILELALDELANVLAHVDFADQIARLV